MVHQLNWLILYQSFTRLYLLVPLMHYDLRYPRSLILIWIIPIECSLRQCQAQTCPERKKERLKVSKGKKHQLEVRLWTTFSNAIKLALWKLTIQLLIINKKASTIVITWSIGLHARANVCHTCDLMTFTARVEWRVEWITYIGPSNAN